ncbi:MAG: hypothetical protein ACK5NF_04030 [Bacilli bacterium]
MQKQINIKFNDQIEEEKDILKFLDGCENKNKLIKDALNFYMVISEAENTLNSLKIMRNFNLNEKIVNNTVEHKNSEIRANFENEDKIKIDIGMLDDILNEI